MQSAVRCLAFAALGLGAVACFNTTKTTHVPPGASNPPAECLQLGASCHSSEDCCSQQCSDNMCVEKK
jgi:hypothetical protein